MGITITPKKGYWIKFQLNINNIKQETVAQMAGCSSNMVTQFLKGRKNSERVKNALCQALHYESFEALVAASRGHLGGAA